ncbi:unnamed protein product [Peniophora sp. CBMAI 1063]|nr:unnamed protein product [Peniophora sp. CBMAI 1063]
MSSTTDSMSLLYVDNPEPEEPVPATGPAPPEAYIPRAGSEELFEYSNMAPEGYVPSDASPAVPTFPEPYIAATPEVKRRSTTHASSHSSLSSDPPPPPPDDPQRQSLVRTSAISLDATARSASGHRRRHTQTSTYNLDDILQAFASSHHDSKDMRRSLKAAMQKLEQAKQRADHADHIAAQLAGRVNKVAGQKSTAAREASAAREELNLYKVQYSNAQRELERGNRALHDSEARRDEAEAAAARARDRARDMRTQLLVERAREEGRRAGLQEGLRLYRGRRYVHEYDEYTEDVEEVMEDILTQQNEPVRSEYTPRSQQDAVPPTRRSTRSTQRTPRPPQQPQYTPSDRTDSRPILMQGDGPTPESFFAETPTPAPREEYVQDTTESMSTDTTSTLPLAPPPVLVIPPQRMSTIHEVPSRGSMVSSVPTIMRDEPRTSSRSSRRSGVRSQPPPPRERTPSPAPTVPLEPHEIPQSPNTAFAPPPGAINYAAVAAAGQARSLSPVFGIPPLEHPPPFHPRANPNVQPQPFIPSAPPSPRGSMYGVGSPNMTTRELQQSFRESRAGSLSGSTRPSYPRVQPPNPIPPRFTPSPQMPAPLAPQPQRQAPSFTQPRPSSSTGTIPQPFIPPPSEAMSSRHGHRRSHSANIPPSTQEVQRPQPPPFHPRHAPGSMVRRSTSGGVPIQISVESPSDPGNTPTPASQPADEPNQSREYLSPRHMPTTLPVRTSSTSSSHVVPSPTSTPRSVSNPLPQHARPNPSVPVAAPLYGQQPDPNSYYGRQPPPVVPSTGTARRGPPLRQPVAPVVPSSSSASSRPQRYPPRVYESQSPEDTRPPAAATSRMYGAPTRSASMGAPPPSNTVPIVVPPPGSGRSPRLANGPLPGQPAIVQAGESAQARPAAYRGQQPVPIPPRHGSPAPLMVPSPEIRGAPLYVPSPEARVAALGSSYAGATPRMGTNGLSQEQGGYIPRSPTGSFSNLAPPSPRGPHANPLFTRFDRNSMENMGDMSQVALATATQPPEESATNVLTRGLRNVFGGRGKRR